MNRIIGIDEYWGLLEQADLSYESQKKFQSSIAQLDLFDCKLGEFY